jgi:hypothetical protein
MTQEERRVKEIFSAFLKMSGTYMGGGIFEEPETSKQKPTGESLKDGYELRPVLLLDKKGAPMRESDRYSHLYHNGSLVSSEVFRKGGMCKGFREGYCSLIHYVKDKNTESGWSSGTHVIVNFRGEIVLVGRGLDSPRHLGGNTGAINKTFYNLLNGGVIFEDATETIVSKKYIFISHEYSWKNKMPLGVYRVDKKTCVLEMLDEEESR